MFGRYPFVRQNDQSDCGAACLVAVALRHRRRFGLEKMRQLTGTDRIGTSLLALRDAAEKLGFTAKGVQGPFEALATVPMPAVAHTRNPDGSGHFVVLHKASKHSVVGGDPAKTGIERLSRQAFGARWTGYLLLLVPDPARLTAGSDKASVGPLRRFLHLLSGHVPILFEAFVCAIVMTVLGLATSFYIQHLVDSVLVRQEHRLLTALGIGMVCIIVFRTLFSMLRQYLLAHMSRKIDLLLMAGYARHLLRLPLQFFETRRVGEILSRIRDADKVRDAISGTTLTAVVDATVVLFTLIVLWLYDTQLALVATAFVPVLVLSVVVGRLGLPHRRNQCLHRKFVLPVL